MSLPSPVCGQRHLATARESNAHFGLPWVCSGTIAVNVNKIMSMSHVTWVKRRFNYLSNASQHVVYPSIFNRFPVIQPVISKVGHFNFSTCFVHFVLPWVRPWDNRGRCYMDGKRIQCWSNALQRIPIYLQPFTSYGEIDICRKLQLFLPLAFNATVGVFPLEFRKKVWTSENYGATRQ